MINEIFRSIWIIKRNNMHEPINIRPLGLFIQNGINDLMFNFPVVVGAGQINKMRCKLGDCFVVA